MVVRRFTLRGIHRAHLLGRDATDRPLRRAGIAIDRLAGGLFVESWVVISWLGVV